MVRFRRRRRRRLWSKYLLLRHWVTPKWISNIKREKRKKKMIWIRNPKPKGTTTALSLSRSIYMSCCGGYTCRKDFIQRKSLWAIYSDLGTRSFRVQIWYLVTVHGAHPSRPNPSTLSPSLSLPLPRFGPSKTRFDGSNALLPSTTCTIPYLHLKFPSWNRFVRRNVGATSGTIWLAKAIT